MSARLQRPRLPWGALAAGSLLLITAGSAGAQPPGSPPIPAASTDQTTSPAAPSRGKDCATAESTLAMVTCQGRELSRLNAELRRYLAAAQQRERQLAREDGRPPQSLQGGQADWEAYRSAACTEVYQHWGNGSIRGPMTMACQIDLTRERLQRIWSDFLIVPDGSPPLLPEPDNRH